MKPFLYASLVVYGLSFVTAVVYNLSGKANFEKLSRILLTIGLAVHSLALIERIHSTGHAPMASMYETLVFFSWTTVVTSLIVAYRYKERTTELITVPIAILAIVFALVNEKPGSPLTLILDTRWFEIHVTASFAAYALFTLAFSGAVLYLFTGIRGKENGELVKYQEIAGRSVLWGFFFFSASMFSGAVWGYLAWGTYWLWTPKELWTTIVWFFYSLYLHARLVRGWSGPKVVWMGIIGFLIVLFTYAGVGLLMKSSHEF